MTAPFRSLITHGPHRPLRQCGAVAVENPAKSNIDFREASRREDARRLERAFPGRSQQEIALKASRTLGMSPRQIVYWLQLEHDMPSWAVKAIEFYLGGVDRVARRIEGKTD